MSVNGVRKRVLRYIEDMRCDVEQSNLCVFNKNLLLASLKDLEDSLTVANAKVLMATFLAGYLLPLEDKQ